MLENVIVEPMSKDFILWRCLHGGPLSRDTIDRMPSNSEMPWARYRERNLPLLIKLTRIYGASAILARDGDRIVGHLRFYPKAVCHTEGAGGLCLQQDHPAGAADDFADCDFPEPGQIKDKTLVVHCLMTGSPLLSENPYQRKGLGSRMVRVLIDWASASGWERIEAESFEDLPIIYEITGSAGFAFWEKLGFRIADRHPHPALQDEGESTDLAEFIATLEQQAKAAGVPIERARDRLIMRLDLA